MSNSGKLYECQRCGIRMRHQESLCRPCKHAENDAGIALHLPDDRDIQVPEGETGCDSSELALFHLSEEGSDWEARLDWGGLDAFFGALAMWIMFAFVVVAAYLVFQNFQPPLLGFGPMPLTGFVAVSVLAAVPIFWICFTGSSSVTIRGERLEVVNNWRVWRSVRGCRVEDVRYVCMARTRRRKRQSLRRDGRWGPPTAEIWVDGEFPIYFSRLVPRRASPALVKLLRERLGVPSKSPIGVLAVHAAD